MEVSVEEVDQEGNLNDTSEFRYTSAPVFDFEGDQVLMNISGQEYISEFGKAFESSSRELVITVDRSKLNKNTEGLYTVTVLLYDSSKEKYNYYNITIDIKYFLFE